MSRAKSPELATGSAAAIWAERNSQSLGWAFRAYERFVGSLSPEVREHLAHKGQQDEAYVVVFGRTQVGKTTLILDMMGLEPASLERVSLVLRGGRAQGQSATATTMEYRRSSDQRWGIRIADEVIRWFDDDGEITSELCQLRKAMEQRHQLGNMPCVLHIPKDCFASQLNQPAVRILDLPGDRPANPIEQEHVDEMARKYVPLADLVLLVGKGDDLSFLQPGALTLPGVEDWQCMPARFRIITTFSFTAQSVRELIRQHDGPQEPGFYRQRLIDQIEKFGFLSEEARKPKRYFPLEFGETWLNAQQHDSELYARISPIIDELKRELHRDISNSTTPMARLRNAVEARVVIVRIKENRLNALAITTRAVEQQLERARAEESQAREAERRSGEKSERFAQRLSELNEERLSCDLEQHFELAGDTPCEKPGKSVTSFMVLVEQVKASLKQRLADSQPVSTALADRSWFWRSVKVEIDAKRVDDMLNDTFFSFLVTLKAYKTDTYITWWSDGYDKDYCSLKNCINEASAVLTKLAREAWLISARRQLVRCQEEARTAYLELRSWEKMGEDMGRQIARLEHELAAHQQEERVFRQRTERDLRESERFIDLLDTEYLIELQNRRKVMLSEERSVLAFMGLLAAVRLTQVRKQLLLHIEPV